jgi:hypothetical protein
VRKNKGMLNEDSAVFETYIWASLVKIRPNINKSECRCMDYAYGALWLVINFIYVLKECLLLCIVNYVFFYVPALL